MKKSSILYWGITGAVLAAGLILSIVKSGDHWEFSWQGAELMALPSQDTPHELSTLQVTNRVLLHLQENYVDPKRLDPSLMLATSLDELQKSVPELLIVFDKKLQDHPTRITVKIGGQSRDFASGTFSNLLEMSLRLREILMFIQPNLPRDIKPRDLEYVLINGMLSTLDPHSVILSPEVYRDMLEGNRGKFGGLGIGVRMIDGILVIMEPMAGNPPAVKAGLKTGDQILSIDGTPTLNMNISEAVEMLKGEPDTTVHLVVMRKGWKTSKQIDVVREEIAIPSSESASLGDRIAYIKLKGFQANSQYDVTTALKTLSEEMGAIEGLVLDLRGNPGGLLDQAVQIADNFLKEGTIVTTVGPKYRKPYTAEAKTTQPNYPIVVLIDASSASASEILAGALKNNDRALILGDTSFGKGSVQVLSELSPDKSALKLTIAQYLTPGDRSIQSVGIVPDIRLVPQVVTKDSIDLYPKTWVRREASLGAHLDNINADKDLTSPYALRYVSSRVDLSAELEDSVLTLDDIDKYINKQTKDESPIKDPEVRLAKRIVKLMGPSLSSRTEMLKVYDPLAQTIATEEETELIAQLKKQNINWSTPDSNPSTEEMQSALSVKLETLCFKDNDKQACTAEINDDKNHIYEAGETIKLYATVTNHSETPIYRIVGKTESSFTRSDDQEFIFGAIEPGASITREMTFKTNKAAASRADNIKVTLFADDGSAIPQTPLSSSDIFLSSKARQQPSFKINYAILDQNGKSKSIGNSFLDDNETITVRVWVSNEGLGTAEKPLVYLKNKSPLIKLVNARAETQPLKTGDVASTDFTFTTSQMTPDNVVLELHVYDKASTQMLVENIGFITSKHDGLTETKPTSINQTMRVAASSKLFVAPLDGSNALQTIEKDTVVKADAKLGNYTHISAGEVVGWLASSDLIEATDTPSKLTQKTIATIPRIILDPDRPLIVHSDTYPLSVKVDAFAELKDCYVYVYTNDNHKLTSTKVAYQKLDPKTNSYNTQIPVKPGVNRIRLYVRDANNSEAYETIQVYRQETP